MNMNGQITNTTFGNGLTTQYSYNQQNHSLESVQTPNVQDYSYYFEPVNGNLMQRSAVWKPDWVENQVLQSGSFMTDNFKYDNLDRLKNVSGYTNMDINYNINGNIEDMTGLGSFYYDDNQRINAVTSIDNTDTIIKTDQNISYTSFNKVDVITSPLFKGARGIQKGDSYSLKFTYNSNHERKKTELFQNDELIKTKYFFGAYEKEITPEGTRELNYITSPDGIIALYVRHSEGTEGIYYLHKDHLGSITEITDQNGDLMQRFYYNPIVHLLFRFNGFS